MNVTAHDVAVELRKFADSLDQTPEAVVKSPMLSFYSETKEQFLNAAKALARPFTKDVDKYGHESYRRIHLKHKTDALYIDVNVPQSLTCTLVAPAQPAKYECDPILSQLEESELVS